MTDILENGYSYDTVLSESYPMNTNMARCRDGFHKEPFQKYVRSCACDERSLSIVGLNIF